MSKPRSVVRLRLNYEHNLNFCGKAKQYSETPLKFTVFLRGPERSASLGSYKIVLGKDLDESSFAKSPNEFDAKTQLFEFNHDQKDATLYLCFYDDGHPEGTRPVGLQSSSLWKEYKLIVTAYGQTWNDMKARCLLRCGARHFSLLKLFRNFYAQKTSNQNSLLEFQSKIQSKKYHRDRQLREGWMTLDWEVVSGDVEFIKALEKQPLFEKQPSSPVPKVPRKQTFTSFSSSYSSSSPSSFQKSTKSTEKLTASNKKKSIETLCSRGYHDIQDSELLPTIPDLCERIRCPEFTLPPDYILPGGSYCFYGDFVAPLKRPEDKNAKNEYHEATMRGIPEEFLVHLKETALLNLDLKEETLFDWIKSDEAFSKNQISVGVFFSEMICRIAWTLQYINDFSNSNTKDEPFDPSKVDDKWDETFKNTFITLSGDCEDLAWMCLKLYEGFVYHPFERFRDETLNRLRSIYRDNYACVLTQCVASNTNERMNMLYQMRNNREGDTNEKELKTRDCPYSRVSPGKLFDAEGEYYLPSTFDGSFKREEEYVNGVIDMDSVMSHTLLLVLPKKEVATQIRNSRHIYEKKLSPVGNRWIEIEIALNSFSESFESKPDSFNDSLLPMMFEGTYPTYPFHPMYLENTTHDFFESTPFGSNQTHSSDSKKTTNHQEEEEEGIKDNKKTYRHYSRTVSNFFNKYPDLIEYFDCTKTIEKDMSLRFCKMFVRGFTNALRRHGLNSVNVCFTYRNPSLDSSSDEEEEEEEKDVSNGETTYYGVWSDFILTKPNREHRENIGCFFYCFMEPSEIDYIQMCFSKDQPTPIPGIPPSENDARFEACKFYSRLTECLSLNRRHPGFSKLSFEKPSFEKRSLSPLETKFDDDRLKTCASKNENRVEQIRLKAGVDYLLKSKLYEHARHNHKKNNPSADLIKASKTSLSRISLFFKSSHREEETSKFLNLLISRIDGDSRIVEFKFCVVPLYDSNSHLIEPVYTIRFDIYY